MVGDPAVPRLDIIIATVATSKTNVCFMHGVGGGCSAIRDTFAAAVGPHGSNRSVSNFRFLLAQLSTPGPLCRRLGRVASVG